LPGVQALQLHHAEEQAQRPGPHGDQEVLPELPDPPSAPGDPDPLTPGVRAHDVRSAAFTRGARIRRPHRYIRRSGVPRPRGRTTRPGERPPLRTLAPT